MQKGKQDYTIASASNHAIQLVKKLVFAINVISCYSSIDKSGEAKLHLRSLCIACRQLCLAAVAKPGFVILEKAISTSDFFTVRQQVLRLSMCGIAM